MPTIESAEKRMRQNEKRRERNQRQKSEIRSARRRFLAAIEEGDLEAARERLGIAESKWDSAASKGLVPTNRARRKISRMKKKLAELEQQSE